MSIDFRFTAPLLVLALMCCSFDYSLPPSEENSREDWVETPWYVQEAAPEHYDNDLSDVSIETVSDADNAQSEAFPPVDETEKAESDSMEEQEHEPLHLYRLKVGDKLLINIYGEPTTKRVVAVDPSGAVSYLVVNSLPVEGKTIAEFREMLQEKLRSYYKYPLLVINPVALSGEFYTIIGEVMKPGNQLIAGHPTITMAICKAGGFTSRIFRNQTVDQADLARSFLARDGQYVPVDFERLVLQGDSSQDLPLLPRDYIYIASRTLSRVYVLGEVGMATSIAFFDSLTLSQAIAYSAGLSPFASSRIAVIRGSLCCPKRYLIDFNRIKKGCALDFPLEPGDIVYVPSMQYTTLKQIVEAGIATFVAQVASVAGTSTFVSVVPEAAGTALYTPSPVINTGGIGTVTSTPTVFSTPAVSVP